MDWNSSPPIANSEQKTILKQIKANPINSSGNNRDYIDFPVSCYFEDKWNDSCIVRFQKFPPFLSMFEYSMDFIRLDSVKDIRPSEFALPSVIRSFGDIDLELGLGDRPLLTYGPNQKFYAVWVGQNFFSLDGLKGSELNLESFLTKFPDKLVNYENSTLPKKYVIVDWDEEMNKYRA